VLAVPGVVWLAGRGGEMLAVDPGTNRPGQRSTVATSIGGIAFGQGALWVLDDLAEVVLKLDPATGERLDRFPVSGNPVAIAAGLGSVWVADASGTVTRLDPRDGTPTGP